MPKKPIYAKIRACILSSQALKVGVIILSPVGLWSGSFMFCCCRFWAGAGEGGQMGIFNRFCSSLLSAVALRGCRQRIVDVAEGGVGWFSCLRFEVGAGRFVFFFILF